MKGHTTRNGSAPEPPSVGGREIHPRERLDGLWREQRTIAAAEALLAWDQETFMPPAGAAARADQVGTLAALRHQRLVSDELVDAIEAASAGDADSRAAARRARRDVDRARKLSADFARRAAAARIRGVAAWQRARQNNDLALFLPHLKEIVELKQEEAERVGGGACRYDALLDEFEPGLDSVRFEQLIQPLAEALAELVDAVRGSSRRPDTRVLHGSFPIGRQYELAQWLAERIGFDLERGRIDSAEHPFCIGLHPTDVRLTWRAAESDLLPGLFGALHEIGHGLYEQGLPAEQFGSPLCEPASLGVHESQSRLWENHVGRSRPFWRWLGPELERRFPGPPWSDLDTLWPALHAVSPSLVRVDADETTYHLHIAVRFELERDLINGALDCEQLEEAWAAGYRRHLGLEPPDANRGVLQDIHWASGLIGYFPTYTVGTLFASQLWSVLRRELDDLDELLASGRFAELLAWLRDRVHRVGARFEPDRLVEETTGAPLSSSSFLEHVRANVHRIYTSEPP